jgi:hypothetical protein
MTNLAGDPSLADEMRDIRREIFEDIGEVMVIGSSQIPGKFFRRSRELEFDDGSVATLALSFDCQHTPILEKLEEGVTVQIKGHGYFRFLRSLPPGGDESGLVHVELGTLK